jgi:hypothetical protein
MDFIALIPGVLCVFAMFRGGRQYAFLNVVVPVLFFLPTYFFFTLKPLPSLNFIDTALLALGAGMLIFDMPRWRFTLGDVWMGIFLLTSSLTDYQSGRTTDAAFAMFNCIVTGLVPYMAGKLLIEQGDGRLKFTRRMVAILLFTGVLSSYEYFLKSNPFSAFWNHFFPTQWAGWGTQVRWGFGRMSGPYAQSELAGIVFSAGLMMAIWLGFRNYQERALGDRWEPLIKRGTWVIVAFFVIVYMTQARGPWLGTIVALAIASIGPAKRPVQRAVIVIGLVLAVGVPAYVASKSYVSGPRKDYGSEKETAQYRAELIDNYVPVAENGGLFGWGEKFPIMQGQVSIDNEYLYVWLTQGYLGVGAFVLLLLEGSVSLLRNGIRAGSARERHFDFSLLGLLLGIAFTLGTVFLGAQSFELMFLLFGWAQAVRPNRALAGAPVAAVARAQASQGLTRVYT